MEYKIIKGESDHCQRVLNQWNHQYILTILNMCVEDNILYILVIRTKRDFPLRNPNINKEQ